MSSNLPNATGGKSRRQSMRHMPELVYETQWGAEGRSKTFLFRGRTSANCRAGANHYKASTSPACCIALLLLLPAPVMHQKRIMSVMVQGWQSNQMVINRLDPLPELWKGSGEERTVAGGWAISFRLEGADGPCQDQAVSGKKGRTPNDTGSMEKIRERERKKKWVYFLNTHLPIKKGIQSIQCLSPCPPKTFLFSY